METPNAPALSRELAKLGMTEPELKRIYRTFNAAAEPFREEAERHGS
jgi:hypothetical protein